MEAFTARSVHWEELNRGDTMMFPRALKVHVAREQDQVIPNPFTFPEGIDDQHSN